MDDALDTGDLALGAVSTRDELVARLRDVYVRADKPSLRSLEARTRHGAIPLSKTAVAEMLNGVRFPRKAVMVGFLQACGVRDDSIESWQHVWERVASRREGPRSRQAAGSWHFSDSGSVTLICAQLPEEYTGSLADPADPNYTELLSYADLDAMVELYGHIRAENPAIDVSFVLSSQSGPDDLSGHLVLIGGIIWNIINERISGMSSLPIRQIADRPLPTGEFVVDHNGEEQRFLPRWADADRHELVEDVGVIARTPNPLNSSRSLTICNGIHSRGVLGAVRTLTDARLRESNESYITENFTDPSTFAILMRVPVIRGKAMTPDFRAASCVLYQWPLGADGAQP